MPAITLSEGFPNLSPLYHQIKVQKISMKFYNFNILNCYYIIKVWKSSYRKIKCQRQKNLKIKRANIYTAIKSVYL